MAKDGISYVLIERTMSARKQICFNMQIKQPILVIGDAGCDKSNLLHTLVWFHGKLVRQLNITPETEPSVLIEQLIPNEKSSSVTDSGNQTFQRSPQRCYIY